MNPLALATLGASLTSLTIADATGASPTLAASVCVDAAVPTTAASATTAAPSASTEPGSPAPEDASAVPDGWAAYTSSDASFSVAFPVEPESQRTPSSGPDGSLLVLVTASAEVDERLYQVNSVPIPAGQAVSLENGRDGSLQQIGATLVSSAPIELAGRPGLEYTGTLADGGTTIGRLYCDGLSVYQVVVVSDDSIEAADPAVAAFFDSFDFLGAAP